MANNVNITPGVGATVETIDEGSGVERQVIALGSIGKAGTETQLTAGQKTSATSIPVVLASDQSAVPVAGTFWQTTQPVSIADGSATTLGAKADAKSTATDTTAISAMSVWKQISASVQAIASSIAGTLTVATHAVTQSGTWTVQPGNTANTTAWKVDGSAVTQPVSGTITADAGTNLNTSALALESGNLATLAGAVSSSKVATKASSGDFADGAVATIGAKADAKSTATDTTAVSAMSVWKQISASIQAAAASLAGTLTVGTHAVTQSGTWTVQPGNTANTTAWKVDGSAVIQPVSGTITANAGTNLNTSALALESGGNLATLAGAVSSSKVQTKEIRSSTGTQSSVASSATDVTILASNANRLGAAVYNDSNQILYLLLASGTSSSSTYSVQLAANDYYEVPAFYTGVIKGIWASANGNARVTEFT